MRDDGMIRVLMLCFVVTGLPAIAAESPLANAAEQADWSRVATLIKEKTDPDIAQVDGMTALHWAAYHDRTATAKLLVAAGASAKEQNRYGVTPLSLACTNGNAEMVQLLLAAGADANTVLRGG